MESKNSFFANFEVVPEHNIIIEYMSGRLNLDLLYKYNIQQTESLEYSPRFNLICDLRDSVIDVDFESIEEYSNLIKQNKKLVQQRRVSLIVKEPKYVALASLFSDMQKYVQKIQVFTSIESAILFVQAEKLSVKNCKMIIKELKIKSSCPY